MFMKRQWWFLCKMSSPPSLEKVRCYCLGSRTQTCAKTSNFASADLLAFLHFVPRLHLTRLVKKGSPSMPPWKSANYLEFKRRSRELGESSRRSALNGTWRKICDLNIPNGTKIFLWKAIKEVLPTNLNLFKRKVLFQPLCPICFQVELSVCHALRSCCAASDVLAEKQSLTQKWRCRELTFVDLWKDLATKLPNKDLEKVASIFRCIWLKRNRCLWQEIFQFMLFDNGSFAS